MKTHIHFWSYLAQSFWELKIFHTKLLKNSKCLFYIQKLFFFENRVVYEINWKDILGRARAQMTIRGMRNACWVSNITNKLTHSMVQSPSWEANWFAASQENPHIPRKPKVHYRTHKRPPPVSILCQPNPVQKPTTHFLQIHPNIIHPSTPRSPQWSPSLRFPYQDPIHPALLTHTRHMLNASHSSRCYHPHNIVWAVQIITITHTQYVVLISFLTNNGYAKAPQCYVTRTLAA